MKFVNASYELIDENDPLKKIELVARTCYKSENKITNDSAPKMVGALIRKGHHAMLEHYHIIIKFDSASFMVFRDYVNNLEYKKRHSNLNLIFLILGNLLLYMEQNFQKNLMLFLFMLHLQQIQQTLLMMKLLLK